jgi:hypothetical protein
MKHIRFALFLMIPALFMGACAKKTTEGMKSTDQDCQNAVRATMTNEKKGSDVCGWMLTLASGEKVNPINLEEFKFTEKEGKVVRVSYEILKDRIHACTLGQPVRLICIKEVK